VVRIYTEKVAPTFVANSPTTFSDVILRSPDVSGRRRISGILRFAQNDKLMLLRNRSVLFLGARRSRRANKKLNNSAKSYSRGQKPRLR